MKPGEEPTFYSDASSDEEDETTAKSTEVVQEEKKSQWGTKARKIHTQKSELIKQQKDPNWTEIINWFYLQSCFFFSRAKNVLWRFKKEHIWREIGTREWKSSFWYILIACPVPDKEKTNFAVCLFITKVERPSLATSFRLLVYRF